MARAWVVAQSVRGRFQRVHRWTGALLQLVLFAAPWVQIGGHPAVWINLPDRRLYALGAVFTPRDSLLLVIIGLFAAFSLFTFTALYGRLWCGYACPQTVFLEEWIRPVEALIEGERGMRLARDRGGWTLDRARRKAIKWSFFALLAGALSMTLVSYFTTPMRLWSGAASSAEYALVAVASLTIFLDFAWFREQFCNYLCPYARFQGALADEESQVVAYDAKRGIIDCIDCKKCVVVCPQGIDIREGFQLECITCARCVDACAPIMARNGKVNLIGYTTLAEARGGTARFVRPRTALYGGLLLALAAAFVWVINARPSMAVSIARAPGSTYTIDADGMVRNTYLLSVTSNDPSLTYADGIIRPDTLPDHAELIAPPFTLPPAQRVVIPVVVRLPAADETARSVPISLRVTTAGADVVIATTFLTDHAEG